MAIRNNHTKLHILISFQLALRPFHLKIQKEQKKEGIAGKGLQKLEYNKWNKDISTT